MLYHRVMDMDQPVKVSVGVSPRETTDLERLVEFLLGTYQRRLTELARLQSAPMTYKQDCVQLAAKANFFYTEMVGWLGVAKRLYDMEYAARLETLQATTTDKLREGKGVYRPTAGMIDARAREQIAPLNDAITRLEGTMRLCDKLTSTAQTIIRSMEENELSGRAEGGPAPEWEEFSAAPLARALDQLKLG